MKKLFAVLLCFVMVICLSGCDLNPVINFLKGRYTMTSNEVEGTILDDGTILFYEGTVSGSASIEFKDSDGNILLDANDISKVSAKFYEFEGYGIKLILTDTGTLKFADATKNNLGKIIYIYINGELVSSPTVNDTITNGETIISNISSQEELFELFDKFTK